MAPFGLEPATKPFINPVITVKGNTSTTMPSDRTRRRLLQVAGTAATLSLAGCATVAEQFSSGEGTPGSGGGTGTPVPATDAGSTPGSESTDASGTSDDDSWSAESVTIESPDISLADVPLPEERTQYARMGAPDASATATVYGNWKCPYTREFVLNQLPEVADRFVRPGDLTLEFRALAYQSGEPFLGSDAPRAARAGLSVWDVDPESYWSYFAHVFANQPQERREWAEPSLLVRFAEESGVNGTQQVQQSIRSNAYAGPVQSTTGAASELGIATVPRVFADEAITAPTVDFESTLSQLESAIGN